jgi:thiamine-monophosphate kinase
MTKATTIAQLGERGLLLRLARLLDPAPPGELGLGDDTALIASRPGPWLHTTDVMVEGTHFERSWFRPEEVGFKALAVNLSDAAAMGGRPTHALVSLILPPPTAVAAVERLYRGMIRLARREGVALLGGNLARGERISITISLFGDFPWGDPVRRSGARPGDRLYVTGQPGLAYLGQRWLAARKPLSGGRTRRGAAADPWNPPPVREPSWRSSAAARTPGARAALRRFLAPEPRLAASRALQDLRPTSLIDVSDGLGADLHHLAETGRRLVVTRLPRTPSLERLAGALGLDAETAILHGGEDYELLFTLNRRTAEAVGPGARLGGIPVTEIGRVDAGPPGVFIERDRRLEELKSLGFQHFK